MNGFSLSVKFLFLAALVLSINLWGCKSAETKKTDIVQVDFSMEYPVLDLKLSDIADIAYIPLKGKEVANFMTRSNGFKHAICMDTGFFFIADARPYKKDGNLWISQQLASHLYMFDYDGNYIRTIVHPGEGADEFKGLAMRYNVDKRNEKIYVVCNNDSFLKVFDYNGNWLYTDSLEKDYTANYLIGNNLICYDNNSKVVLMLSGRIKDQGAAFSVYDVVFRQL